MTPAERKLLVELARAVWTRINSDGVRNDLAAAIDAVEREQEPEDCAVAGFIDGQCHTCILPKGHQRNSSISDQYHNDGRVRWLGYHEPADNPPPAPPNDRIRKGIG